VICVSTRGRAPAVSFRKAIMAGLAPDGGLYVPQQIPRLSDGWWQRQRGRFFQDVAVAIAEELAGDEFDPGVLTALVRDALNFPVPIVKLDDRLSVLELFHGPTFAFKDFGARTLARLMSHLNADPQPLTVLVATSGDTGGAVAHAFFGVAGTRVVVLYPEGQVSDVQEAQFTTLGGNVTAIAVRGSFDDCQRLAKEAFADSAVTARVRLTSANSISLGRLLPQVFYYAWAALQFDEPPVLSVPSGNFGNLAAGVMAWKLGAPIAGFSAPTTINDTFPRFLESGRVEPRPSVPTLANAMDVGNPSNLERLQWLFDADVQAMRQLITSTAHTDAEVRTAMVELRDSFDYIADPHTAIAFLGTRHPPTLASERASSGATGSLFLATAHPAKFRDVVEPVIRETVQLPAALADTLTRGRVAQHIGPNLAELVELL
jgi:threonine synthase